MERERFDGADVAHLIRARAEGSTGRACSPRFGPELAGALRHLVLFGFIYPSERSRIPAWVLTELSGRLQDETARPLPDRVCRGTILSRAQYLVDIEQWGYRDARLRPEGTISPEDMAVWTEAIQTGK
jgi:hypothetical protein